MQITPKVLPRSIHPINPIKLKICMNGLTSVQDWNKLPKTFVVHHKINGMSDVI